MRQPFAKKLHFIPAPLLVVGLGILFSLFFTGTTGVLILKKTQTIDGSNCNFIDYDILEIISEFENKAKDRYITLYTIGIEKVDVIAIH